MKGKELTKTCKYCNNTYIGSIEELREIFVKQPNCEHGLQAMCKRCRNEKYKTDKYIKGVGARATVEDLIDLLNSEGYPTKLVELKSFLEDNYLECDLSKEEWIKWISNDFYNHIYIKDILEGKFKKCKKCNKWFPYSLYYDLKQTYKDSVYIYKYSYCKACKNSTNYNKPDKQYLYNKKYRESNREKLRQYEYLYRQNHKEQIKRNNFRHELKKYLKKNSYSFNDKQIELLTEFKFNECIKSKRLLIAKYEESLCLKKI